MSDTRLALNDLRYCFEGAIPAIIATASAAGVPNVTYLSTVRIVDDERVALSNQFFSKTVRNLAENPRASLLLVDPTTYDEFRLTLVYERTDRRGPVFERLRDDLEFVASLQHMEHVFRLRAADIYRVVDIEAVPVRPLVGREGAGGRVRGTADAVRVAELSARLSRCPDLDSVVAATVEGLADVFGYDHSILMLLDESGTRLYTIASHGYPVEGVGSEVVVGEGMLGLAAERCTPVLVGNLRWAERYSRTVRRRFEAAGEVGPGKEIPVPGLPSAVSRLAVPAMALGELIGVLMVESPDQVAFDRSDEAVLTIVASLVANAIEVERSRERAAEPGGPAAEPAPPATGEGTTTHVRFFAVDGSTFVDGDYLIKGVAGRILWALLGHHAAEGRVDFTNREVRLDPTLELPEFRDNFESRLILLKRRLDERSAPIRIEKTGRGRFRLHVRGPVRLDAAESGSR